MHHKGKAAFLISKPLQLMIALCMVRQDDWDEKPVFIIVDAFLGAGTVASQLLRDFTDLQVPVFFNSRTEALRFFKNKGFDQLFIDSDIGFKNFLNLASQKLSNPQLSIHVYEEGLGTYRNELYHGFKKVMFGLLGIGIFFGACRYVTSVYVFNTQEYSDRIPSNKLKVRAIRGSLSDFISKNRDALKRIFGFNELIPKSEGVTICSIYLSNWSLDYEFISCLKSLTGDVFVKPHPHIKVNEFNGAWVIGAGIPAELVVAELMETYKVVNVFDHNSSVRRYISGNNLTFALVEAAEVNLRMERKNII